MLPLRLPQLGQVTQSCGHRVGCQTQKAYYYRVMTSDTPERPRLTPKGERTRARIIDAAARLIYERGVAGTTLDEIRTSADVSGSQLQHYFAGKDELVQAVIGHQADTILGNQRQASLGDPGGLQAWRNMVVTTAKNASGRGGCPLGSLGGQLAESDPQARALIAAGFEQWSAAISDGLRALHAAGHLRADLDPDDLAVTILAAVQGGLLLAQVQRDARPLETAVDTVLALATGKTTPSGGPRARTSSSRSYSQHAPGRGSSSE
jgi:TetR/AcrR family transcriptional regulator, transcriptional repressor for nem operon